MTSFPKRVCVRRLSLLPLGYDNLREYIANENNALVCRAGRVFVKASLGRARPFHYKASPWANQFVVGKKQHSLNESLALYETWLDSMLQDNDVRVEFRKLLTKRNIGCFCEPHQRCHVDVILRRLKELK